MTETTRVFVHVLTHSLSLWIDPNASPYVPAGYDITLPHRTDSNKLYFQLAIISWSVGLTLHGLKKKIYILMQRLIQNWVNGRNRENKNAMKFIITLKSNLIFLNKCFSGFLQSVRQSISSVTQSVVSSVTQSSLTSGLPVHHQLPEFAQTHVYWVSGATQPSHLLSSPSPPAFNLSQHQGLFK